MEKQKQQEYDGIAGTAKNSRNTVEQQEQQGTARKSMYTRELQEQQKEQEHHGTAGTAWNSRNTKEQQDQQGTARTQ